MVENDNRNATSPGIRRWGSPESEFRQDAVADRIKDFLAGRTHGEELLHALYDHVLHEAIPERIGSLFKRADPAGDRTCGEIGATRQSPASGEAF
jgi:hypothetical protein